MSRRDPDRQWRLLFLRQQPASEWRQTAERSGGIREPSCSPCLCMSAVGLAEADVSSEAGG